MPCSAAVRAALAILLMSLSLAARAELTAGSLDVSWNVGAGDCTKTPQPPLQVHRYNSGTFILRENPCATYEAPFLYLLVGSTRALLIDTGAVTEAAAMPLARTVRSLLPGSGTVVTRARIVESRLDPVKLGLTYPRETGP